VLVWIVHAFGGSPVKFWYQWLAAQLEKEDNTVVEVLRMTNPHVPTISNWCRDLDEAVAAKSTENGSRAGLEEGGRDLYLVGHSVGCQAIVRWLAEPQTPDLLALAGLRLRGVFCVAAWFSVVDPWETIDPWCSTPIECDAAQRFLERTGSPLHVILSDNDKYTPDYETNGAAWRGRLRATVTIIPSRAHFGSKTQPDVLAVINSTIK